MEQVVYVLVYLENSDDRNAADVFVFGKLERAQEKMHDCYTESLRKLGHNVDERKDDYLCWIADTAATIVEGYDSYAWSIEEMKVM